MVMKCIVLGSHAIKLGQHLDQRYQNCTDVLLSNATW